MSLGGYKFAGRFCQKGSLTDQQWALLMHKTKVAAFMAANALANAGWDYDMAGSPDGNYHCLDSVGNNYVTVFKRQNGENEYVWFAIYTLGLISNAVASGYATISLYVNGLGTVNNYYLGASSSNFIRIGKEAISYSDSLTNVPDKTTLLFPVGNIAYSGNISTSNNLIGQSSAYYGYAVKGSDIIIFSGKNISSLCVSVVSLNAFSNLVNDNDDMDCCILNLQGLDSTVSSCYESASRTYQQYSIGGICIIPNNSAFSIGYLFVSPVSTYSGVVSKYPFQSVNAVSGSSNSSGVFGKGTLKLEMLSYNANLSIAQTNFTTLANGNYLVACSDSVQWSGNNVTFRPLNSTKFSYSQNAFNCGYPALYVGWDPSNPDITQASAWTVYTDA